MPVGQVTLGAGATQLTAGPQRAMQLIFAPAAHTVYVGDAATVSASKGIPVPTTGPVSIGPFTSGAINLNQWYAFGTAADVVTYQYTEEE